LSTLAMNRIATHRSTGAFTSSSETQTCRRLRPTSRLAARRSFCR
jgi:hypothetical protein